MGWAEILYVFTTISAIYVQGGVKNSPQYDIMVVLCSCNNVVIKYKAQGSILYCADMLMLKIFFGFKRNKFLFGSLLCASMSLVYLLVFILKYIIEVQI